MKYFLLDSNKKLIQVSLNEYEKLDRLRVEGEKELVLVYEDNNHSLLADGVNDIDDIKDAILKMLKPYIFIEID